MFFFLDICFKIKKCFGQVNALKFGQIESPLGTKLNDNENFLLKKKVWEHRTKSIPPFCFSFLAARITRVRA